MRTVVDRDVALPSLPLAPVSAHIRRGTVQVHPKPAPMSRRSSVVLPRDGAARSFRGTGTPRGGRPRDAAGDLQELPPGAPGTPAGAPRDGRTPRTPPDAPDGRTPLTAGRPGLRRTRAPDGRTPRTPRTPLGTLTDAPSGPSRHNLWIDGLESNDVILLHGELLFRGEFPAALTFINGTALGTLAEITLPRAKRPKRWKTGYARVQSTTLYRSLSLVLTTTSTRTAGRRGRVDTVTRRLVDTA